MNNKVFLLLSNLYIIIKTNYEKKLDIHQNW